MKIITYPLVLAVLLISSILNSMAFTLVTIYKRVQSSETRNISSFSGITSSGNFNVKVTMGTSESLRIEADPELFSVIETYVERGILIIRYKNRSSGSKRGKATIYVTAKELNNITASGSGNINIEGTLKSNHVNNIVSGSGSIALTTETTDYTAVISGSGKISINGNAKASHVNISGSGNFDGKKFNTDNADIKVSGSGSVLLTADETLDAKLSGSGNIRYSGQARVSETKSGSGNVRRL